MKFLIQHNSGKVDQVDVKSLLSAKQIATKALSHGGGTVAIYDGWDADQSPLCVRKMWEWGNAFGWEEWVTGE